MDRRARRTQAERTASTRAALLNAAVDSLVERGFARTTTTEVAFRAGVSLGALLHHFPTKSNLLIGAVEHVVTRRQNEFRASVAGLAPGASRLEAAIDLLWSAFDGPTFRAWVELWVGSRTDPQLSEAVRAMDQRFQEASEEIFQDLVPPQEAGSPEFFAGGLRFTMALMDGVALRGLIVAPTDSQPIELLKNVARLALTHRDQEEK